MYYFFILAIIFSSCTFNYEDNDSNGCGDIKQNHENTNTNTISLPKIW